MFTPLLSIQESALVFQVLAFPLEHPASGGAGALVDMIGTATKTNNHARSVCQWGTFPFSLFPTHPSRALCSASYGCVFPWGDSQSPCYQVDSKATCKWNAQELASCSTHPFAKPRVNSCLSLSNTFFSCSALSSIWMRLFLRLACQCRARCWCLSSQWRCPTIFYQSKRLWQIKLSKQWHCSSSPQFFFKWPGDSEKVRSI